jgi:hypothetical protein
MPAPDPFIMIEGLRKLTIGDTVIAPPETTDNILASGSIISGWFARMQRIVSRLAYFLRTLQTNFNPLRVSNVTAGRSGLTGRQGIATHL